LIGLIIYNQDFVIDGDVVVFGVYFADATSSFKSLLNLLYCKNISGSIISISVKNASSFNLGFYGLSGFGFGYLSYISFYGSLSFFSYTIFSLIGLSILGFTVFILIFISIFSFTGFSFTTFSTLTFSTLGFSAFSF